MLHRLTPEAMEAERGIVEVPVTKPGKPSLQPMALDAFLAMKIPPRSHLLAPWLREKAVTMLYAPRGIGKTWTSLGIAHAVATGGTFLRWRAPQAAPVLYLDGEMAAGDLQERLAKIVDRAGASSRPADLRIVAADLTEDGLPCLATDAGQRAVIDAMGNARLVVIDNIATLVRAAKTNEAESWMPVQRFALALRRKGVSTLFVHHSGKSGDQRGTSAKEDVMDSVVRLSRPDDYDPAEGARFTVEYTKARGFYGNDAEPFEAHLDPGTGEWSTSRPAQTNEDRIVELALDSTRTQRDIAEKVGVSVSYVNKVLQARREKNSR